jgi:hypothetical protein
MSTAAVAAKRPMTRRRPRARCVRFRWTPRSIPDL